MSSRYFYIIKKEFEYYIAHQINRVMPIQTNIRTQNTVSKIFKRSFSKLPIQNIEVLKSECLIYLQIFKKKKNIIIKEIQNFLYFIKSS